MLYRDFSLFFPTYFYFLCLIAAVCSDLMIHCKMHICQKHIFMNFPLCFYHIKNSTSVLSEHRKAARTTSQTHKNATLIVCTQTYDCKGCDAATWQREGEPLRGTFVFGTLIFSALDVPAVSRRYFYFHFMLLYTSAQAHISLFPFM